MSIVDFNAKNSIFWNNGGTEFEAPACVFNVTHSILEGGGVGVFMIDEDPLLESPDVLVPIESSPCIGGGTEDISVSLDIDGNLRPQPVGSSPDIGAYELEYGISSIQSMLS